MRKSNSWLIVGGLASFILVLVLLNTIIWPWPEFSQVLSFVSHNVNETGETEPENNSTDISDVTNNIPLEQIPAQSDLVVPFTSQAPYANWDLPYQEFCEEAAVLMVHSFHAGLSFPTKEDADQKLRALMDFENSYFGDYKDTTAAQTAEILREFYGYKKVELRQQEPGIFSKYDTERNTAPPNEYLGGARVEVLDDFDADTIKFHIANNRPVILPSYGRALGNPNYTSPGPLYHMLVIRGYNQTHFITNDSGTRLGEKFTFPIQTVLDAAHDWNNGDVPNGAKKLIVVYPEK